MIVAGRDEDVAAWMLERVPWLSLDYRYEEDGRRRAWFTAIGWADARGELLAAVVYDDFQRPNICMHIAAVAGKRWMAPIFFAECFRYPFEQLGCARVTGKTPASNDASLTFQLALGFKIEGRVRCALPNAEDLIVTGMLKSECRWLALGARRKAE